VNADRAARPSGTRRSLPTLARFKDGLWPTRPAGCAVHPNVRSGKLRMNSMEDIDTSGISIALLAENKKTIPIYFKTDEIWHTNVKLPDIVIRNNSVDIVEIKEISLFGFAEGENIVMYRQAKDTISDVINNANLLLNKFTQEPISQWKAYNLHVLFGNVPITQESYEETNCLKHNSATCVRLCEIFFFHYAGGEKVDEIICEVTVVTGTMEITKKVPIPLTLYKCRGNYTFPITGSSTVIGTPWNQVEGHRTATSQEFAFDVVDYQRDETGNFVLSSPPNSNHVKDYFVFEREVHAVGSGIVVATGNQWPNEWVENPLTYSVERVVELTQALLKEGVDFNHAILGNYVIIDHNNGEFSLYAHMSQNTLTVEVGDNVHRGQVIGKVGNTSNSEGPHLHFQLMDSKDFQTANGLPVMFDNIPIGQAPFFDFKETNSLLYSDYLFVQIPE
jgi:hypothetical protein